MDSKTTFLTFLLCIFLFSHFSPSSSKSLKEKPLSFSPSASLPTLTAERLIKGFNLLPTRDVNVIDKDGSEAPRLVEREFDFSAEVDRRGSGGSPSVQDFGHHAGYYKLPNSKAARMFYFFFESRTNKADPVVIWLTGGPGCSSELALFYENGPFTVSNNSSLTWNEFGWDKASNLIYVDQPVGTGFSYTSDQSDLRHDEEGVSNDLYDFLQAFFKEHPQFVNNDFYITGESYAGHYIPALASRVHRGNKNKEGTHINLKGFAIGNGLTNPEIQYGAYADYALDMKLITQSDHDSLNRNYATCQQSIKECSADGGEGDACASSYVVCNNIFQKIMDIAGNVNYYDVRKQCEGNLCYDFSNMEKFLNQKSVRRALGVGDIEFVSCSTAVYDAMQMDWMRNLEVGIPALLQDGIKLLVYAGEYDLICNWLGNSKWVHQMEWSGQKEFVAAATVPFLVDNKEAGLMKNHGSLTFLKVHDAGHMVPMDQPKAALQMLQNWMQGKLGTPTGRTARQ
ncbi:PREDICTED: serine carboxypeptidase-like 48 [Camelina sativa]|uniref:Carboxypeptidase n=1 Tax=Camelina sativa TaxID=90675 RepID=A0ABM0ZF09_CAMSA|nr:PREDICTED: serine carboxypeptidase-like 48 [Camelina sativa]